MMGPGSRKSVPSRGKDGARSQSWGALNVILQLDAVYARKTYTPVSLYWRFLPKTKQMGAKKIYIYM